MSTSAPHPPSFLVFGHRGSPKRFSENTIESFEETLRVGADGFETDLRLLSDRTAVLFHDDEWEEEEIETMTSLDVAQRGASLVRVSDLSRFSGRTTMILEVKRSRWEDVLLSEIGEWAGVVVASFDHTSIAELARRQPGFDLGLTTFGRALDPVGDVRALGVRWVFPNFRYIDTDLVSAYHEAGARVIPWTVNRERDWERIRNAGCDGLITDFPGEAVEWRDGKR